MSNTITITVQMGDHDPASATFALPGAADDFDYDDLGETPPRLESGNGAGEALDTAQPPDIAQVSASGGDEGIAPPDFEPEYDAVSDDLGLDEDEPEDVLPPEV